MTLNCTICPRNCNVDRNEKASGYCRTKNGFFISSITVHHGEEPPISGSKGICNVFFAHCNLQCIYCQNFQISDNKNPADKFELSFEETINQIKKILDSGINILGFVSPSHFVEQMIQIIKELNQQKYFPTIVYNTNGYDKIETLQKLEKYVDIYLPDLKYSDSEIAKKYSGAKDYPQIAFEAIKEMHRQKDDLLYTNRDGYAESGMIIRHLVLPNHIENSLNILRFIANEISQDIHVSLMSQYYPTANAFNFSEISRTLNQNEYKKVVAEMKKLNLNNGWIQELSSNDFYKPDFEKEKPFE
ncbi:MAG: radical SAM protein [Bacteroidales bacterium]|nr:radical SAM protein [Bacteroidales bacterium]